jgi:SAM-dependent methyltransferase
MVVEITDKGLLRRRIRRAARNAETGAGFLLDAVIAELMERLSGVERRFSTAIAYGGHDDRLAEAITLTGKADRVLRLEHTASGLGGSYFPGAVADDEALPLGRETIDLFVSALSLQWANDLPGALIQIRQALRPDGLFLAAMTGGRTLAELREALFAAETEILGGASPRVLPTAEVRDLGALLQRAGFTLPVADRDLLTVRYGSAFDLMRDIRGMGASNVVLERDKRPAPRRFFLRAAEIYAERFSDADHRVRASFEIVSLSGWSPHESQQKPARRGSGQVSPAQVLGSPRAKD